MTAQTLAEDVLGAVRAGRTELDLDVAALAEQHGVAPADAFGVLDQLRTAGRLPDVRPPAAGPSGDGQSAGDARGGWHPLDVPTVGAGLEALAVDPERPALAAAARRMLAGDLPVGDPGSGDAMERQIAAEQHRERCQNRWRRYVANRPASLADVTHADLQPQQDPDRKVTRFAESQARALLLVGPSRHGKTWGAFAIGNALAATDRDAPLGTPPCQVVCWSVAELYDRVGPLEAHERRDEVLAAERDRLVRDLLRCQVLILDDLGKEPAGDGWSAQDWRALLFRVAEARLETPGLRTVVTANAEDPKAFVPWLDARYGEPIRRRLMQGAVCAWVQGEPLAKSVEWNPFA